LSRKESRRSRKEPQPYQVRSENTQQRSTRARRRSAKALRKRVATHLVACGEASGTRVAERNAEVSACQHYHTAAAELRKALDFGRVQIGIEIYLDGTGALASALRGEPQRDLPQEEHGPRTRNTSTTITTLFLRGAASSTSLLLFLGREGFSTGAYTKKVRLLHAPSRHARRCDERNLLFPPPPDAKRLLRTLASHNTSHSAASKRTRPSEHQKLTCRLSLQCCCCSRKL